MEVLAREVLVLETKDGKLPFVEWFDELKDQSIKKAVDARLTRVADGNFGDHKSLGDGVFELRIPRGPGIRVYYGLDENILVILIAGGDKSSQKKDIKKAKTLWKEYKNAK
ncbi:MAG: type II toxin-antitoxin system RelE/ParE family toxin [Bdellovibrionales bacterium]|nr:type II toxin-antitoxin system RelE/ParE family toxin [Bdellovibrionales bacterium]